MGKKLYIGNLPYSCNDQILREIFAQIGDVASARVIVDGPTGRSKGFGFVEMATDELALEAIGRLDGVDYDGRPLRVAEAQPPKPREGGFGGGRGGPRGGAGGDRP